MQSKTKRSILLALKIAIDLAMVVLFTLLMSYHLLADATHEWIGLSIFILFILHNILNYRYYLTLFKGKYNVRRVIQLVLNLALWAMMILCILSSLGISGHIFSFIDMKQTRTWRSIHLFSTMWAFILTSLHLGFHMVMFISMVKVKVKTSKLASTIIKWSLRVIVLAISAFAIYIFVTRKMYEEMFMLTEFKWFDYEKNLFIYILENVSLVVLCSALGHYLNRLLMIVSRHKKTKINNQKAS